MLSMSDIMSLAKKLVSTIVADLRSVDRDHIWTVIAGGSCFRSSHSLSAGEKLGKNEIMTLDSDTFIWFR